jgi:Phosphotransferase enzyme family
VDSATGRWWLKVNAAGTAYEARVLAELSRTGSSLVPQTRSHPTEPWCLVADAGQSAREALQGVEPAARVRFWTSVLADYAELQRATKPEELRSVGLPDLSAAALLDRFDEVLIDRRWFTADVAPELSRNDWELVQACRPRLAEAAARLADTRPSAVQHDDLHDGNVFGPVGALRIIDWGDASLAHPFGTLLVTLRALASQLGYTPDDPRLDPVRDAYLEVWRTGGESMRELHRELDLAVRTGCLARAAAWRRALGSPEAGRELDFADAVAHWMVRLAQALVTSPDSEFRP